MSFGRQDAISPQQVWSSPFIFLKDLFIFFLEGEKHQCVGASHTPPTEDLIGNPAMCPDWDSNWQPFGSQAGTQPTEPHQPGLLSFFWANLSFPIHPQPQATWGFSAASAPLLAGKPILKENISRGEGLLEACLCLEWHSGRW